MALVEEAERIRQSNARLAEAACVKEKVLLVREAFLAALQDPPPQQGLAPTMQVSTACWAAGRGDPDAQCGSRAGASRKPLHFCRWPRLPVPLLARLRPRLSRID
jgi:hypothetical protein